MHEILLVLTLESKENILSEPINSPASGLTKAAGLDSWDGITLNPCFKE